MFINIITPCSRPENLLKISKSINIPKDNYRWIVVFDSQSLPDGILIPDNCEPYFIKETNSISGNAQRNYALGLVYSGYVYFNDDDTIIHPELWVNVKDLDSDFISFMQESKDKSIRLTGNFVRIGEVDSHNFLVHYSLIGDSRWVLERYEADGIFAVECFSRSKNHKYIDRVLSTYNALRE